MADVPLITSSSQTPLADDALLRAFDPAVLDPFLSRQRWFAGKARRIANARLADRSVPAGSDSVALAIVEVAYADGGTDRYFLPLAFVTEPVPGATGAHAVLARVGGARTGFFVDALSDDASCRMLLDTLLEERAIVMQNGTGRPTAYAQTRRTSRGERIARSAAEQSNSCILFDERFVLKLLRRLEAGPNPELEISRVLAGAGFSHVPPLIAALEYRQDGADATPLAMVQGFVENRGSGWDQATADVRQYLNASDPAAGEKTAIGFLELATLLGRRTAELHLALAAEHLDPAFAPEPFTVGDAVALAEQTQRDARNTLASLSERLDTLSEPVQVHARAVLHNRERLMARVVSAAGVSARSLRTRVHGDYHLGQVLVTGSDFVIIDFEGEPARPLRERRAKHSPLKDVAGMVRSFGYAAHATLLAAARQNPRALADLAPRARAWDDAVSDAFVGEYRWIVEASGLVPAVAHDFDRLLDAFVLEKAVYELGYELASRPEWIDIPLLGILQVLGAPDQA